MVLSGEILVLLLQDEVVLLMGWDPVGCRGVWSRKLFSRNPINQHGTTQLRKVKHILNQTRYLATKLEIIDKEMKKAPHT